MSQLLLRNDLRKDWNILLPYLIGIIFLCRIVVLLLHFLLSTSSLSSLHRVVFTNEWLILYKCSRCCATKPSQNQHCLWLDTIFKAIVTVRIPTQLGTNTGLLARFDIQPGRRWKLRHIPGLYCIQLENSFKQSSLVKSLT